MKTLLVVVVALGSACAADVGDELAGESTTDDGVGGKADAATDGVYTYFQLHTASGGYSLTRINRSTTVCANGATKASCTVPTLDWSEANLTAASSTKVIDAAGGAGVPAQALVGKPGPHVLISGHQPHFRPARGHRRDDPR